MFHVIFCILLLFISMLAVADKLPRLWKRERESLFVCYRLLVPMWFLIFERFPLLPLSAWDRLCYFIVALPGAFQLIILSKDF